MHSRHTHTHTHAISFILHTIGVHAASVAEIEPLIKEFFKLQSSTLRWCSSNPLGAGLRAFQIGLNILSAQYTHLSQMPVIIEAYHDLVIFPRLITKDHLTRWGSPSSA